MENDWLRDSCTYRAIIREGEAKGRVYQRKENLLLIGERRFGRPEDRIIEAIRGMDDAGRLQRLMEELLDVSSWDELLAAR